MALTFSPKPEVFFVLNSVTNAPLTGAAGGMSFGFYAKDNGTPIVSHPSITEIGNGFYRFQPVFADPTHGIVYSVLTTGNPIFVTRYCRPEDYFSDYGQDTHKIETNKWQIFTSGPNINTLCLFDDDGTTILYKFDLKDSLGNPTTSLPFSRNPA